MAKNAPGWVWLHCASATCDHKRAVAIVPLVIRWGADTSSDKLRQSARCERCGHKGALTYHPSWTGDCRAGWQPFPTDRGVW